MKKKIIILLLIVILIFLSFGITGLIYKNQKAKINDYKEVTFNIPNDNNYNESVKKLLSEKKYDFYGTNLTFKFYAVEYELEDSEEYLADIIIDIEKNGSLLIYNLPIKSIREKNAWSEKETNEFINGVNYFNDNNDKKHLMLKLEGYNEDLYKIYNIDNGSVLFGFSFLSDSKFNYEKFVKLDETYDLKLFKYFNRMKKYKNKYFDVDKGILSIIRNDDKNIYYFELIIKDGKTMLSENIIKTVDDVNIEYPLIDSSLNVLYNFN